MRDDERPAVLPLGELRPIHLAIAEILPQRPELIAQAREATRLIGLKPTRRRWRAFLDRPVDKMVHALRSGRMNGVLYASPFLHVLSSEEQQRLLARGLEHVAAERRETEAAVARQRSKTKVESKLARLRVARGWSQSEMARRAGIAAGTYWKLERRRIANPPVGYLAACARALGVPLEDVVEDELLQWGLPPVSENRSGD